jgi:hypothetical protein
MEESGNLGAVEAASDGRSGNRKFDSQPFINFERVSITSMGEIGTSVDDRASENSRPFGAGALRYA